MSKMQPQTVNAIVSGMKKAGINFVAWLPSQSNAMLLQTILADPAFTCVPVSHEGNGVGVCAGAWMGGKKPALVMQNSGFVLCIYALMGMLRLGGFPTLFIVDHRGGIGDKAGRWLSEWGRTTPLMLDMLQIPYSLVTRDFEKEIVHCQWSSQATGKPVVALLTGEEVYGYKI